MALPWLSKTRRSRKTRGAVQGLVGTLVGIDQLRRQQLLGGELLHHLVVLDLHVEPLLVPIDQLFQGRRQLTIGGDDGHQLPDVELAGERQVAADRIEEERGDLGEQVVEKLDHELPLVEAEAQVEELVEAVADLRPLPGGAVVDVHGLHAVHHLADAPGELARHDLALLAEPQLDAPQLRDHRELHRHDAAGDDAEPDVLDAG